MQNHHNANEHRSLPSIGTESRENKSMDEDRKIDRSSYEVVAPKNEPNQEFFGQVTEVVKGHDAIWLSVWDAKTREIRFFRAGSSVNVLPTTLVTANLGAGYRGTMREIEVLPSPYRPLLKVRRGKLWRRLLNKNVGNIEFPIFADWEPSKI